MHSKEERSELAHATSSGDAFAVGRFSREEAQTVAREGALPYLDEAYRGGREEPREAGAHDIIISENDPSFDLMGVEIIGSDAFVGRRADVVGDAFVGHRADVVGRTLYRSYADQRKARAVAKRLGGTITRMPGRKKFGRSTYLWTVWLSGNEEVSESSLKPSPKMLGHLQQIASGLESQDSGQRGTARADYQSHVERARGGDRRSKLYLKIIDRLREQGGAVAEASGEELASRRGGYLTSAYLAGVGAEVSSKRGGYRTSRYSTAGDAFVSAAEVPASAQLAAAKKVLDAANAGDKKAQALITAAAQHAGQGNAEAVQAMKLLNLAVRIGKSASTSLVKGDAFVGHHRPGHILSHSLGAICGADTYRMGLASGNEEAVFDMEDGAKDSLDPFFKDPDNVYNDAVAPQEDVELDDAAAAEVPELVASIMGGLCGMSCYRKGL